MGTVDFRLDITDGRQGLVVPCLDARNLVRFAVAGDGKLIDNLGTSTGSRAVEMYNGRAVINVQKTGPLAAVSVSAKDLPTALLTVG